MNEIATILKEFTPGAAGVWTGVLMFAAYFLKEWRETRKLSAEDRLARRDGYQKQVELLLTENRALLADQAALRKEYDDHRKLCYTETEQLRKMLIDLQGELEGLKRRVATDAIEIHRLGGKPKT